MWIVCTNLAVAFIGYISYSNQAKRIDKMFKGYMFEISELREDLATAHERNKQLSYEFRVAIEQANEKHIREIQELQRRESEKYQSLAEHRSTIAVENASNTIERTFKAMSKALEGEFLSSFNVLESMLNGSTAGESAMFKKKMKEEGDVEVWN